MFSKNVSGKALNLETGWLCLDYANTVGMHASENPLEHIHSFQDLTSWSVGVGLLSNEQEKKLVREAAVHPRKAVDAYQQAIALREALYNIFSAEAAGLEPSGDYRDTFISILSKAIKHLNFNKSGDRYTWELIETERDLERQLWPIAISAAELLVSDILERVGECADEGGCGWLFMDTSKNKSRRWCDMDDCGSRSKSKRYYNRKKQRDLQPSGS
jgi:predicted RNA-binding Zn ribbon-like protein